METPTYTKLNDTTMRRTTPQPDLDEDVTLDQLQLNAIGIQTAIDKENSDHAQKISDFEEELAQNMAMITKATLIGLKTQAEIDTENEEQDGGNE